MVRVFGHFIPRAFLALACAEIALLIVAVYLGVEIRFGFDAGAHLREDIAPLFPKALAYALVIFGAMIGMGLYTRDFRDGNWGIVVRTLASLVTGLLVLGLLFYLIPGLFVGRGALAWALVITAIGIISLRILFLNFVNLDRLKKRVLVLGAGERATILGRQFRRKADRHSITIVGYIRGPREQSTIDAHVIEHDRPLSELVRHYQADEVVIALDDRRKSFPVHEIVECRMLGTEVLDLLSFVERNNRKILLEQLSPSWLIFSEGFRYGAVRTIEKRVFDITASLLLMALAWPLMLITAIAILVEGRGRGPVLYRQTRVGEHGEKFEVLKFRSMTVDAEGDGTARWAGENDARVTRVGAFIRKYRIDELPQFYNVLRGDMSFVGPRPERPEFEKDLSEKIAYYGERHRVKPGITGWAQICYPYGASERDAEEKLQYDLYYVKNYSIFLDLVILFQTVQAVLWKKGAR